MDKIHTKQGSDIGHLIKWPVVSVGGVRMHERHRVTLLDCMQAIRDKVTVMELGLKRQPNSEVALRTRAELSSLFPSQWLAETQKIAQYCNFDMASLRYEYPAEVVPPNQTAMEYLTEQAQLGLARRYPQGPPERVSQQLAKELELVAQLEYAHFFLTIYDIVQFAERSNILYQGRGSAANSVLCYCLGITAVNPAQSELLFERFISAERNEPPDIDVDFEHQRREEVIQYIYKKYGRKRAALAATVITYRLRSAMRDIGKVLGFPEAQLTQVLARLDRRDSEDGWQQQLVELGLLQHPMGALLCQLVIELIGAPRHLSQHVGGFVIAAGPLTELVPVENAAMADRTVVQWDKDDIEALKLLKVDVLALGMLTALHKSLDLLRTVHGVDYQLAELPQEDPRVYEMLQRADSIGVFQIESRAQMNMLPRLKPATFYDLVVQIAIVRPGPIQGDMVHPYLRRRAGEEAISYPGEAVKSVLQRTLGVPIFQEQVIKLAMIAAGFSGGEADQLRRAMATWKSKGQLMAFKDKLLTGMQARGYQQEFAERLYEQICGFGEYGFPESHAASFANLAYASAWLKCHYPAAFYVGLLNSSPMGFYSAAQLIQDARRHEVIVLPVCVNQSEWHHQLINQSQVVVIRLGLRIIKGFSQQAATKLLAARPAAGFSNLTEIQALALASDELEALASANALQVIAGHRYQTRWQLTELGKQLPLLVQENNLTDLQLAAPDTTADMVEDYASLGLTLGEHPLTLLRQQQLCQGMLSAQQLQSARHQQVVAVMGLVVGRQRPSTSAGVTFVTLEDETGNVNVLIWQQTGRQQRRQWLQARLLEVHGVLEKHGDIVHVIAGRLVDRTADLPTAGIKSRDFH